MEKKNSLVKYATFYGLDPKKIQTKIRVFLLLSFLLAISSYLVFANLIMALALFVCFAYLGISQSKSLETRYKKDEQKNNEQFASFLSYSIILLQNGFNVYQTLQVVKDYLDPSFAKLITTLLEQIDEDKSIIPYTNFASNFNSNIIVQLAVLLYQLQGNGYDAKYLEKFPGILEKMRANSIESKIRKRKESFSMYSLLPIAGLIIMVFVVISGVLSSLVNTSYV